jgi:protein-tyrosine phosphatase
MDNANLADLRRAAPKNFRGHLGLFLAFARTHSEREVPDPYYGEGDGFEKVLDLIEDAAAGLLNHLQLQLTSSP